MNKEEIFSNLSVEGLNNTDLDKYSEILGDHYDQFVGFCDFIKNQTNDDPMFAEAIDSMSCKIDDSGAHFDTTLKNGEVKSVRFDNRYTKKRDNTEINLKVYNKTREELEAMNVAREEELRLAKERKAKKRSKKSSYDDSDIAGVAE